MLRPARCANSLRKKISGLHQKFGIDPTSLIRVKSASPSSHNNPANRKRIRSGFQLAQPDNLDSPSPKGWIEVGKHESDWQIYRTRFLIRARQLTEPFVFRDALGREHRGRVNDYLVESSDGTRRIAPREIFEDVYVAMGPADPRGLGSPESTQPSSELKRSVPRSLALA